MRQDLKGHDQYQFMEPAFIFGEQEWSFGKHYFQVDVAFQIDPLLDGSNMSSKRK